MSWGGLWCAGAESAGQESTGLRLLRGFICPQAPAYGWLVRGEEEEFEGVWSQQKVQGLVTDGESEDEFKHRLREGQTVHMSEPHSGSSELPAP